jgi:hypothetical protein
MAMALAAAPTPDAPAPTAPLNASNPPAALLDAPHPPATPPDAPDSPTALPDAPDPPTTLLDAPDPPATLLDAPNLPDAPGSAPDDPFITAKVTPSNPSESHMDVDEEEGGDGNDGSGHEEPPNPLRGLKQAGSPLVRQVQALEGDARLSRIWELQRMNDYERMRQTNIARPQEKLKELGLVSDMRQLMDELKGGGAVKRKEMCEGGRKMK